MKNTEAPIRWGIIGLGAVVVGRIAPALLRHPGSQLRACTSRTLEKTRDFAENSVSNALHFEQAIAVARAGKHILCEKPLALSVNEGRQILEACSEARVLIRASWEIEYEENDLVVEGTKGMLSTSGFRRAQEYVVRITDASGTSERRFAPTPAYHREIEAFAGELRGERSVLATGEEGVRIIELASAVLQSIETRHAIGV